MTSIVESITGKRGRQDTASRQVAQPHANTAQALAFVQRMHEELEFLREETGRLRAELNVATMRNRDLERERETTRADLEAYRRYSVTVKAHLQHIVDAASRANEEALEAGDQIGQPVERAEKVIDDTKRELRQLAVKP